MSCGKIRQISLHRRPAFDFEKGTQRETIGSERAAGRKVVGKVRRVDLVHLAPLADVLDHLVAPNVIPRDCRVGPLSLLAATRRGDDLLRSSTALMFSMVCRVSAAIPHLVLARHEHSERRGNPVGTNKSPRDRFVVTFRVPSRNDSGLGAPRDGNPLEPARLRYRPPSSRIPSISSSNVFSG